MRIVLVLGVLTFGAVLGTNLILKVDQIQQDKMDQICQIDPSYCQ
jgi:cell division protein FtsB